MEKIVRARDLLDAVVVLGRHMLEVISLLHKGSNDVRFIHFIYKFNSTLP